MFFLPVDELVELLVLLRRGPVLPPDGLVELLVLLRRGPVIPPDGVVEELALPLDELVLSPVLLGDEHVFECTRASPLEQRASKQMK